MESVLSLEQAKKVIVTKECVTDGKQPEILDADKVIPPPVHNGLYQILLAMKYLRSSDEEWTVFVDAFDKLIQNNISVVSLTAMNLPTDWKAHLIV